MAVHSGNETDATPRQIYHSMLAWCDQLGMTEQAARMRAAGPPSPQEGDANLGPVEVHVRHTSADAPSVQLGEGFDTEEGRNEAKPPVLPDGRSNMSSAVRAEPGGFWETDLRNEMSAPAPPNPGRVESGTTARLTDIAQRKGASDTGVYSVPLRRRKDGP
ncbi:hypothetical protein [Nocardia gipuzkoensis]